MALMASFFHHEGHVELMLDAARERVAEADIVDVPEFAPATAVWVYWDEEARDTGENVFLGIEISRIDLLTESDITALASLDTPHVTVPTLGLTDATVGDVLRWVKQHVAPRSQSVAAD